jgi:hypothetical protein
MNGWRRTHEVTGRQSSQIAVRLIDEFTGTAPLGRLSVTLEIEDGGQWHDTGIRSILTSNYVVTYPGLERRVHPAGVPPRKYRVLVDAEHYFPLYADPTKPGVEALVTPWNEGQPAAVPKAAVTLLLTPAPTYPFASHVRVLRGVVRRLGTNEAVQRALVREGSRERVLADDRGAFALPLRWPAEKATSLNIDADDQGSESGSVQVDLPAALGLPLTIFIS